MSLERDCLVKCDLTSVDRVSVRKEGVTLGILLVKSGHDSRGRNDSSS